MSTRTSSGTFAALLALAACAAPVEVSRVVPDSVIVADRVVVAGPPGYCVDTSKVRETGQAAFVLLGSCASLTEGERFEEPSQPGVLTVLVSGPGEGEALSLASDEQLESFFNSTQGRAALSADGQPDMVEVLETQAEAGQIFVRARDLSQTRPAGVDSEYWRALVDVRGHLVTATLIGFEDEPLEPSAGLLTMTQLTDRLLRDNPRGLEE